MSMHIPDPVIARGAPLGMPPSLAYSGAPENSGGLVTVAPAPQPQSASTQGRRQRAVGLIPAKPGSLHPMIVRDAPRERINPADVSKARATLRRARKDAAAHEAALLSLATDQTSKPYKDAMLAARDANDLVAACVRKLSEMEAASASRPIRVVTSTVREPGEVAEEIANGESRYVCLHDGCRQSNPGGWADEGEMRRAHPTDSEMRRAQQCHVFVLLCDAPLDPLDPEGERIGYVAPVGSDGTTVAKVAARVEEESDRDAEVADLKKQIDELRAMIEGGAKPKK